MGFNPPGYLKQYLNTEWRKPPDNFIDFSSYYAGLDTYFMTYMRNVIRPCLAYSTAVADNLVGGGARMNVGQTIKKTAVRLVKGDKVMFEGDDSDCHIISDYWANSVNFEKFLESAIDYMFDGRCVIKLNKDARGRCVPVTSRIDRNYAVTDESGEVLRILMFSTFLTSQKFGSEVSHSYWLIEERYYKGGKAYVKYKVHMKEGNAISDILPVWTEEGISERQLPDTVRKLLAVNGIKLNKPVSLPFRDGLGVWLLTPTANNSCIPGLAIGDPLLYGSLDLLWAVDTVFSGTLIDVINGKGKVLVPKKYLNTIRADLQAMGLTDLSATRLARTDALNDNDDTFVYVYTEHDKDFTPQSVQFDIRAEPYRGMLEMYLQQIVSHCGFSPTSIFPFLSDGSTKTATEITAEENLTRSTVQTLHQMITPILNRIIDEVLYQFYNDMGEEYDRHVTVKLSDYIGNPIQRDNNIRENYREGLIPQEVAVKRINNISDKETKEYIGKLEADERKKSAYDGFGGEDFDLTDAEEPIYDDNEDNGTTAKPSSPGA